MHKLIVVALVFIFSSATVAKTFTEESLNTLANKFVNAKNARQQPETTVNDIEHY